MKDRVALAVALALALAVPMGVGVTGCARQRSVCGDFSVDPASGEQCDDGNLVGGDGCSALCRVEMAVCGDAACDMAEGETCSGCPADCAGDPLCTVTSCGDGTCDLADGETCGNCPGDCATNPACTALCGDAAINGAELCDGMDLGGMNCTDVGFTGGTLACNATCNGYVTTGCSGVGPVCGDLTATGAELCDGTDLAGMDCTDVGFGGGVLACNLTCDGYVTTGCTGVGPVCGDGAVSGGETCDDGAAVGGDGCSGTCMTEAGWMCSGMPSACTMTMGTPMPTIAGQLVITEIMRDPVTPIADADGEWFEVYNPTGTTFDLGGLEVRDDGTDSFIIAGPLLIAGDSYIVFARNIDTVANGGLVADYEWTGFTLGNVDDEVEIRNGTTVIDRVAIVDAMFPSTPGSSANLNWDVAMTTYTAAANDTLTNWCDGTSSYGTSVQLGTPGADNITCP